MNGQGNTMHRQIHRRKKHIRRAIIFVLLLIVLIPAGTVLGMNAANEWNLTITMNGDPEVNVEYGSSYEDAGAAAYFSGTMIHNFDGKVPVRETGTVDVETLGTYTITYYASYRKITAKKSRTVTVRDTTAPVITLASNPDSYTLPGQSYTEEGYTATDNHDGDLTSQVQREEKDGKICYSVTDSSGNKATAERTIVYDDRTPPVITLDETVNTVFEGSQWTDSYSAADDVDGDVTANVTVSGSVDTSAPGDYTLTYTVSDSHGNASTVERTVTVKEVPKNDPSKKEAEGKIIYLTFDDGPSEYTGQLLDLLKKYNVKATFFVTGHDSDDQGMIAREASEGHSIGIHTYSHDYQTIYSSVDAFWSDFEKMEDVVEEQTGSRTNLMRFPGGSSNTVSSITPGIMTTLTQQATVKGYSYFDWNVSSGDAASSPTADSVYQNITTGVQGMGDDGVSVVLCHDTKAATLEAMNTVIPWALQNGYTFLPLSESSFNAHHNVQN